MPDFDNSSSKKESSSRGQVSQEVLLGFELPDDAKIELYMCACRNPRVERL